jgi:hypothetical protein
VQDETVDSNEDGKPSMIMIDPRESCWPFFRRLKSKDSEGCQYDAEERPKHLENLEQACILQLSMILVGNGVSRALEDGLGGWSGRMLLV